MKSYIGKSDERKSNPWDHTRDRMSPAESILYVNMCEVHPGAGLVKCIPSQARRTAVTCKRYM